MLFKIVLGKDFTSIQLPSPRVQLSPSDINEPKRLLANQFLRSFSLATSLNKGPSHPLLCFCCLSSVIVRVRVVFRKTVVGDWRFDYLSRVRVKSLRQMMVSMPLVAVLIARHRGINTIKKYINSSENGTACKRRERERASKSKDEC